MKLGKLFLAAAIALGMMACSNDDTPVLSGEKDATISIKVFPSSDSPGVRAIGDLTGDGTKNPGLEAESAVKSLEVWVFAGDVLDAYGTANGNEIKGLEARIGNRDIIVVANAGLGKKDYPTKTKLLAAIKELPTADISKGLIMTAEPFNVTLVKGKNYYGYDGTTSDGENYLSSTPVSITRVNARVAIVSAVLDYANVPAEQTAAFDELKDVEVVMFNVPGETKLFGTPLTIETPTYNFGADWNSISGSFVGEKDGGVNNPVLAQKVEAEEVNEEKKHFLIETAKAPYFYVNENSDDETNPMFIVLRAKVYKDNEVVTNLKDLYTDDEGFTYYPVKINKDGDISGGTADGKVYRNTQYNISLTIKGLGNPSITPGEKAWLDVKVEVDPWNVVNQNVIWK